LIEELERTAEQDEQIRQMIARRNRLGELKARSDNSLKQSVRLLHETATSPKKSRLTASVRKSPFK